jgi:hypothetical protein
MPPFRADEEQAVRELFDRLERDVELVLVLGPEQTPLPGARDIDFGAEARAVLDGLAGLGERVTVRVVRAEDSATRGNLPVPQDPLHRSASLTSPFRGFPAICVLADGEDTRIRYYGLPWGYEVASIVGAVLEAGRAESSLAPETVARLGSLERDVALEVFVTPT